MTDTRKDLFERLDELTADKVPPASIEDHLRTEFGIRRAVLVLDSMGFSRTTRAKGITPFLISLQQARKTIAAAIENSGCLRHSFLADNFTAEFTTTDDALRAALGIRNAIEEAQIPLLGEELYCVTIGIGYGEFLETRNEGVYGSEMNLASKLGEDIGAPGEILLTQSAFEDLPSDLKADCEARDEHVSGVHISYYAF